MTDTRLNDFVSSGTAAARASFTPAAPTPAGGNDPGYVWTDTDKHQVYGGDGTNFYRAGMGLKGSDIASATTITIGDGDYFHVTGTTTITDIDFSPDHSGRSAILIFDGILTLTYNATTLKVPTSANITTAAGDSCLVVSEDGTDNVKVVWYQRADGSALSAGAGAFTAASTTEQLTGTSTTKGSTPDSVAALWEKGSDVASSGTISLGEGGFFHITGTTTITDIDFGTDKAGRRAWLVFDGALTLTHNATTLILPTGANITTAAGDSCLVVSEDGADNVRVLNYTRKDGTALSGASSLTVTAQAATADTNVGTSGWTDITGVSMSLAAGTYLIRAYATVLANTNTHNTTMQIYDSTGSNKIAFAATTCTSGLAGHMSCEGTITLGSTSTVKLQGYASANTSTFYYSFNQPTGDGGNPTGLVAVKIS